MSHLKYFSYPGVGMRNWAQYSYSQAVRVGNRIECSGQGPPPLPCGHLRSFAVC
jgi:enamine deaminase RidA (YjgF/YER057c/UK114 family)